MADETRRQGGAGRKDGKSRPVRQDAPAKPVSPARAAAFDLLLRVATTSAHSDDLLHGPRLAGLSQADRDLTMALVLGVLRWQIALDARVRSLLSRPDLVVAETVAIALRLGAFQLLHMERIPAHAALNESVELVRAAGHVHAAGMVNAVLRKVAGAQPGRKPLFETTASMAERLGHPAWLAERWTAQYGRAAAEAICAFDQQEPRCGTIFGTQGEDQGFPRMDDGSRLVAELSAAVAPEAQRVWDCCAAPGGKTMVLAKRLPNAQVLATDKSPLRLNRLAQRLERELPGRTITTGVADAAVAPESLGTFDLILCDVPCSGTGTLARNPEIRQRLRPEDLRAQRERQQSLLHGALQRLAPGGRLVYSTCSLEGEECEQVVQGLPGNYGRLSVAPVLRQLQDAERLHADEPQWSKWVSAECLRTLPGAGFEGDGFFAAIFERK